MIGTIGFNRQRAVDHRIAGIFVLRQHAAELSVNAWQDRAGAQAGGDNIAAGRQWRSGSAVAGGVR